MVDRLADLRRRPYRLGGHRKRSGFGGGCHDRAGDELTGAEAETDFQGELPGRGARGATMPGRTESVHGSRDPSGTPAELAVGFGRESCPAAGAASPQVLPARTRRAGEVDRVTRVPRPCPVCLCGRAVRMVVRPGRGRARRSPRIDTTGGRTLTGATFLTENSESRRRRFRHSPWLAHMAVSVLTSAQNKCHSQP